MSSNDEFLYPAATPLLVEARGNFAITMRKMFARNKELRGRRRRFMRKFPSLARADRPRQEEGRLLGLGIVEQNFSPIRDEYKGRNFFIYLNFSYNLVLLHLLNTVILIIVIDFFLIS